jgi:hypothetical protein
MDTAAYLEYMNALNFRDDDVVCVSFGKDKNWVGDFFQPFATLKTKETMAKLSARNDEGQNIYISMAPFVSGTTNRKKEFIAGVRHVFADADADGRAVLEKINADVDAGIMPDPAIGIESSPGKVQVIWHVNGDFNITNQEATNRAIQARYNTDPATIDTARVLRVAGFINHKYAEKPEARILAKGTLKAHSVTSFKIEAAKAEAKTAPRDENNLIPHGYIHDQLVSQCGKFAKMGMPPGEASGEALVAWAEFNCAQPLDLDHVRQVARSTDGWKRGDPFKDSIYINGKLASTSAEQTTGEAQALIQTLSWTDGDGFMKEKIAPRAELVRTLSKKESVFFSQSINQIYAWRGTGKTNLGLGLVRAFATGCSLILRPPRDRVSSISKARCPKVNCRRDGNRLLVRRTVTLGW